MPVVKLTFTAHYLNFDDVVCSDKCFFDLNTKTVNSCRFPGSVPMVYVASLLVVMGEVQLSFIT